MILVDSSVWIDHLRRHDADLQRLLANGQVLCHPFVIGEIAVGSIKERDVVLRGLGRLGKIVVAHDDEVLHFVSHRILFGLGIGYVDAHLLASVQVTRGALLWTRDKRLLEAATKLGLAFQAATPR